MTRRRKKQLVRMPRQALPKGLTVVAFSGKAGTGKDECYTRYLQPLGFTRVAFGDFVKEFALRRGDLTAADLAAKGPDVRDVMQGIGEAHRQLDPDHWIKLWAERVRALHASGVTKVCAPDVRHFNELDTIQQHGGLVYRLYAPDRALLAPLTDAQRAHVSETSLDAWDPHYDPALKRFVFAKQVPGRGGQLEALYDAVFDNRLHLTSGDLDTQVTSVFRVHDLIAPDAVLRTGGLQLTPTVLTEPGRGD